ncbi:hypothetical protein RIF29_03807 [Crotalaria pallida]|uniref:Uncharacterized protein n=1 Tax=Crotalaria pallida TaxID=3830 RepID=A0AAN9J0J6_CROPI
MMICGTSIHIVTQGQPCYQLEAFVVSLARLVEPIFIFVPFKLCEFQLLSISLLKLRSVPVSSRAPSDHCGTFHSSGEVCRCIYWMLFAGDLVFMLRV